MPRRKPRKAWYLKQENPLWIFKVHSKAGLNAYLSQGCVEITKKEYLSYEKPGKQEEKKKRRRRRRV